MPFPPSYGGVIDIFYKIQALKQLGVKIILHVFLYDGKEPSMELTELCSKIYYYNRKRFSNPFSGELPYIVSTRNNDELLINLLKTDAPILFEGLHTTYLLPNKSLKGRFKLVRTHNVEHLYYKALEEAETGFFKKYFFRVESERLAKYEETLKHANAIAAISPQETDYYKKKFNATAYVPAFHSNGSIECLTGRGKFILYHGNLGVGENNKAALHLVHEVFQGLNMPIVVAGNNPSRQLKQAIKSNPNISLADHINSEDILKLVQEAHINTLVTFQSTGIKLKLLNSLFLGRHCVVNTEMVENTGLEALCHISKNPEEMKKQIEDLWLNDFSASDANNRKLLLSKDFDNLDNANKLLTLLFNNV